MLLLRTCRACRLRLCFKDLLEATKQLGICSDRDFTSLAMSSTKAKTVVLSLRKRYTIAAVSTYAPSKKFILRITRQSQEQTLTMETRSSTQLD